MTDDEMIAMACGVPQQRYACGCVRPFSMRASDVPGDSPFRCPDCRQRDDYRKMGVAIGALSLLIAAALVLWWVSK
jgi:hypothetical protein